MVVILKLPYHNTRLIFPKSIAHCKLYKFPIVIDTIGLPLPRAGGEMIGFDWSAKPIGRQKATKYTPSSMFDPLLTAYGRSNNPSTVEPSREDQINAKEKFKRASRDAPGRKHTYRAGRGAHSRLCEYQPIATYRPLSSNLIRQISAETVSEIRLCKLNFYRVHTPP